MDRDRIKVAGLLRFLLISIWFIILPIEAQGQIGIQVPKPPQTVDLFEPNIYGLERVSVDSTLFRKKPSSYVRKVKMDSAAQYISVRETIDNTDILMPAVVDLDTYMRLRVEYETRELWKQSVIKSLEGKREEEFGAIQLDIPFRIKSKTFTRIFGSDRIGLRVTGNISFDLSGRTEERSGSAVSAIENQNTFSPRFRQTQQFTVEGKIGEKVTVSVEQNSEATVDIENTLKLRYDGDEDEIVQKIEAGNISLSLPSTKYVIFGGSNQGLFGLKAQMQVGNLHMTTIASLEKGQQQELSITGSSSESQTTVKDIDFIKNRYFFVDQIYRDGGSTFNGTQVKGFEEGLKQDPQTFIFTRGMDILQLDVFVSTGYADDGVRRGAAVIEPRAYASDGDYSNISLDDINVDSDKGEEINYFRRLDPERDYRFDKYRGFLTLNQTIDDNKILAVSYVVSNPSTAGWPKVGTLDEDLADDSQAVILKLIKPRNIQPSYEDTWPLMMRNVYSLGGSQIEQDGFDVRLQYNVNGDRERYPPGSDKSFLTLLRLDILDENGEFVELGDEKIDNNPYIINRTDGILIFPALRPFNPPDDSFYKERLKDLSDDYIVKIYELSSTNTSEYLSRSKYELIITSRSTKSTFDLGFYVLEGSEVVTLGGRTLQRDKDYIIDYFSGQLTLLSPEAKRSSSNIQIKYERANLFQLDKKTILGGRMEYRFWENSFVGLTALYLNKSTLDRRVRVGQEPFRNFVWDVNAAFKFEPRFITRALDWLPLIETNADSRIDIEGEFAQVIPNPNTLNNEKTGDKNGVAYIDDFEASKRTTTLGIRYRTWTMASPPVVLPNVRGVDIPGERIPISEGIVDTTVDKSRARIVWFNPYHQTPIQDIWPNRDVNAQTGRTTDVLGIDFWRDEDADPDSAWAGIMRSTVSFADQQKTKYIEMWVKGNDGTVNIDIGRISEDWYLRGETVRGEKSRGSLNTEDRNNNGLLDAGEDVGIDGVPDGNPLDDPFDNWSEPQQGALNVYDGIKYDGINGTEGNSNSREARYPDTEDLDGDGSLTPHNAYFEYTFSLDSSDAKYRPEWVAGSTAKGWRLFRIPLKEISRMIGSPDENFQQIFFVRLWFSDLPPERTRIKIATLDFVGNEWEEEGIAVNDSAVFVKNDSLFTLETYNTEENAEAVAGREAYVSPPGVTGVRDRITNTLSKEQSLVMRLLETGLAPGEVAQAKKTLYSALDLLNYRRMRMFIHGDQILPAAPPTDPAVGDSSHIRFYLRFGSNDKNYYEYGQDIYAGWNTAVNNLDIDLDKLAATKDPLGNKRVVKVHGKPDAYYKSVGTPSLKTIRYFIIGVKHRGNGGRRSSNNFTGEVWLDELRLSDVRKEKATALRVRTNIKLADFLTFNAQWESKDADFHNISTQFGQGNTQEQQSYSGKLNLDKLLPDAWDLSIPIDARASFSRNVPKYKPRTDELTGYKNDTFTDKMKSLLGFRQLPKEIEDQVSETQILGVGTTIKKRSKSKHWYIKYTIDQLLFDFDFSRKHSSNWETRFNDSENYKESVQYKLPLGQNFFVPLKFASKMPLLKALSTQKLYYTPQNISMNLNISDSESRQLRRNRNPEDNNQVKRVVNTASSRSVSANYKVLESLDFSISRSYKSDADFDSLTHQDLIRKIFTEWYFGLDTDISQSFQSDFNPNVARWLRPRFSFSSNFTYNLTNGNKYQQSSNTVQKRANFNLNVGQLLSSIYDPEKAKKKAARSSGRRSRRSSRRSQDKPDTEEQRKNANQDNEDSEEDDGDDKPSISIPNPLTFIYKSLLGWGGVQTTLTFSDRVQDKYLDQMPDWKYQLGFSQTPQVQDSTLDVNLIGQVQSKSFSMNNSTSLNLSKDIKASLSHNRNESESISDYGQNRSGSKTTTYFVFGDDPVSDFQGLTDWRAFIPDWNVQVSGVEKWLFFEKIAQSITLSHAHAGKYSEKLSLKLDGSYSPTSQTFSNNWQPLIGMNIRTKWGVSGNMRMTSTTNYAFSSSAGATKNLSESFTMSMSYSKTSGFKIPIPVWPFKGKTFKNEINFNLTFDSSTNKTFQRQFGQDKFEEKQKNKSWKLRPSATYRFSSRVQGSLFYEMGSTENKISGTYSYNEFGITVNIAIRD